MTAADAVGSHDRLRTRVARGRQPQFFEDPSIDKLLAMIVALAGEMSVLGERLDTHERLAEAGLVATPEAIENYEPSATTEDQREASRAAMLSRVFRVIEVSAQIDRDAAEQEFRGLLDAATES